ncbi:MAG: DUF1343 domain-containing protein [Bacteroidetes bacterium]|nr:DUF1343 domain-containing protein [Bacteroidota bacterium]
MPLAGIDAILDSPPDWRSSRVAMVTNNAATTAAFRSSRLALLEAGFGLTKLLSPEHGLLATGADGHAMLDGYDELTGLPVVSLYGDRLAPGQEDLADIDVVLFDIPDIGCRFYTYLWTLTHVMEACARWGRPLVIADRPNPLSGRLTLAEGPGLDEKHCSSFIGRWELPIRHSCTIGELSRYFNTTKKIGCSLDVVPCQAWRRDSFYPDWRRSFVPLSPAIPDFESALFYPGLCLFEATNLSEGRGTATPFRVVGAPWLEGTTVAAAFNKQLGDAVAARPVEFTPAEGKYAGRLCKGVMLHVRDAQNFRPVETGWLLLALIRDLYPDSFAWAPYPTHVNPAGRRHLDLLLGIPGAETIFASGNVNRPEDIRSFTDPGNWIEKIRPFLLYHQD